MGINAGKGTTMTELDKAKLSLAKDYINKALKLIEGLEVEQ